MTATEEAALSAREKELNKMYEELLTSERDGIDLTCAEILNAAKKADVTSDILALAEVGTEYLFGGIAGLGVGILDKPVNYVMGRIGRQILSESTQKGLDQFAKSTAGKMLYNVKNYLGEAGEEAIMQVVQPYIERGVGDLDTANATMKEVAEAGGVGALLSMVLGVPGMAYHVGSRGVQKAQEIRLTGLRPKTELYSEEKLSDASRSVISSFAASEEGSVLRESAKNNERMTKDEVRDIFDDYLADQGMSEKEEEAIREEIEASGGLSVALAVNMGIEPSRLGVSVKSHLKDLLSGKGDLAHRSDASEVMTDGQRIYTNAQDAVNDLVVQSKKANPGTDLAAYIADEHGNRSISLKAGESNVPIFRTTTIDAKTNARMDRMRNAKTETERTGLMYGVKDSVIAFAEEVSKGSGRKIVFDAGVGGGQLSQDQIANASYENGEIHINPNSKNPVAQILAHELTHSIEGTAYYEQMKKLVFKYYRSSLTEAQANVKWTYEGQVKSIDDINSEVMAEFFEKKGITDMETLRSIVKENRSFAEKFVDWLNRIIQRITGTKEQRFLLKVRNQWKKALRETKEGIKNTPAEAGVESLYSISRPLKDTDLADYLQAGKRRNKGKQEALERGEKIILTSDEEIRNYILSAIRGNVDMPTVAYAKVSKELSDAVKEANKAFDIEDSYLELVASDLRHAYLSHHKAKEPGDIDLADSDFLNIPNYLENFDRIEEAKRFKNGKQEIMLSAKNENGKLLIVEIVSRSRDSLMFKTMWGLSEEKYEKRKGAADSRGNQKDSTALRSADASSKNSILDSQENVNKKSISQKADAAYMAAVKRGDMDEAQRMVDEAAKAAGYSVKAYHGTNNFGFTVFENENPQHYSPTIFFADRTDVAESYANFKPYTYQSLKDSAAVNIDEMDINQLCEAITKEFQKDYAKSNKIVRFEPLTEEEKRRDIWGRDIRLVTTDLNGRKFVEDSLYDLDDIVRWLKRILKNEGVYGVYLSMKNPIVIDCKGGSNREIDVPDALKDVDLDGINPDTFGHRAKTLDTDEMAALAYRAGYDGVVFKDVMDVASELHEWDPVATDYVVFNSSQVKSADPVTYDDNGNVIPLSERFDEKQSDIRYSVAKTTDGRNCVFADSDILYKGRLNGRTEVQAVADAIASIVGNDYTVLSTGNVTYIGKDLPGEYLYSESAARLVKANKSIIKAKNLASGHLGELIEIAVGSKTKRKSMGLMPNAVGYAMMFVSQCLSWTKSEK